MGIASWSFLPYPSGVTKRMETPSKDVGKSQNEWNLDPCLSSSSGAWHDGEPEALNIPPATLRGKIRIPNTTGSVIVIDDPL
jgi:hypothetical protein